MKLPGGTQGQRALRLLTIGTFACIAAYGTRAAGDPEPPPHRLQPRNPIRCSRQTVFAKTTITGCAMTHDDQRKCLIISARKIAIAMPFWRRRRRCNRNSMGNSWGRLKPDDASVPIHQHGYWYYSRFVPGLDYPVYARRTGTMSAPEELSRRQMAGVHRGRYRTTPIHPAREESRERRGAPRCSGERRSVLCLGRRQQDTAVR